MRTLKLMTYASSICLFSTTMTVVAANKPSTETKKSIKPINMTQQYFGFGPNARIQINGFLSAGASVTDAGNGAKYNVPGHGDISDNLSFAPNSLAGLQITGNLTPDLAAIVQVVATGEDTNGQRAYIPSVDWAFVRYRMMDDLQFRIGRMRSPLFLFSQTEQVGYTYAPIFLPPEVYRLVPFYDFNGVDFTYTIPLGSSSWNVKINPFFGENTSKFDLYTNAQNLIPAGTTATFQENYLAGAAVDVGNQNFTLHGSWARVNLSMDLPSYTLTISTNPLRTMSVPAQKGVISNQAAYFWAVGSKMDYHNVVGYVEYAHRSTPEKIASLSGYYGLLGYRINKFLPYVSYARLWTTNQGKIQQPGSELAEAQSTIGVGSNYYFTNNIVGKLGVSRITPLNGTNGLFTQYPGKHVLLYSAEVDVVF